MKILIEEADLQERVDELAKKISKEYEGKTLYLLCILKGSVMFLADLAKKLDTDLHTEFHFVEASSYGESTESSGSVEVESSLSHDEFEGKDVLIVEDIIDTGRTLSKIKKDINSHNPASLKICTLLDKPERRVITDVEPEYIGFTIPDKFVIGYGLDYDQQYRNLPFIGILDPEDI